ncbi:hypothetical protein [Caproiciproducens faecalis]|uniref:Topoisomerase 6 subunit A/Spo11 TOPRIM domain-containing protein n=1 Tax=Caproiciproducens faecalis TaxID=2820301 RepID=A0ABS7DMF0_9FIRM|nr:hypothetical protein [Caproiciproducens faecalis]MBW7572485.1 hypothetical protein [Caproiciproducens faecalis]
MEFKKQEWTQFRSMDTLTQKAGVSKNDIPKLVAKELTDNALDITDDIEVKCDGNKLFVWNGGTGIPADRIAELFSINRPLVSTKLIKLPTRGALGNGLRVVVGAVIATGGELFVYSNGDKYKIDSLDDGSSKVMYLDHYPISGTMIELSLGDYPIDDSWAQNAVYYNRGEKYKGKTSAYWYNSEGFYEITQAFDGTVYDLVSEFDGCTGAKAGQIAKLFDKNYKAPNLSFEDSESLLSAIRDHSKPVKADRLGEIGEITDTFYSSVSGTYVLPSTKGKLSAEIPYKIEVLISPRTYSQVDLLINKSTAIKSPYLFTEKKKIEIWGVGVHSFINCFDNIQITINVNSPVIPITSDGKEPDLTLMKESIDSAIQKTVRKFKAKNKSISESTENIGSQKAVVLAHLDGAISKASGDGTIRFSERQLYYVIRPFVMQELNKELEYDYFGTVITDHEKENENIDGMYRDCRGSLYTPHLHQTVPMGTLTVEQYHRPEFIFNKVLYIEKEGLFEILKDVRFPERYDCALLTSKGYASRAIKDLLDLLGETDEELEVYCIHDCDAAGTMIYQTLVEETQARGKRKVNIIDFGLNPKEATEMMLPVENVEKKGAASASSLDRESKHWLETNRVELNAMTSPQFVTWIEEKFNQYACSKIVPQEDVLRGELKNKLTFQAKEKIQEEILQANNYENRVEQYLQPLIGEIFETNLSPIVSKHFETQPADLWKAPISAFAEKMISLH